MSPSISQSRSTHSRARLRALLGTVTFTRAPGVYDSLSARLVEREGFTLAYASGGSIVRSLGLPDLGLADLSTMASSFAHIAAATRLPVIADGDTGYGNELNVAHAVQTLERTGIAAVHFEDQTFPKRCGHDLGVTVIAPGEMAAKLRAAAAAREDAALCIIARTDALGPEGLDLALERALLYQDSGADMVFVEGPPTAAQLEQTGRALALPKLLNCGPPGQALPLPDSALAELGFRIVIFPADLQCASIAAMARCLKALRLDGRSAGGPEFASLEERDALVDTQQWQQLHS